MERSENIIMSFVQALLNTLYYLVLCWLLPVVIILSLTYICRNSERALDSSTFGPKAEIYFGFIGIMVHETSHFLMAVIFNHRINDMQLLVLPSRVNLESKHPVLGYVNQSYNPNSVYQTIGNAFIGTAPIYGCTAALYGIYRLFTPSLFNFMTKTLTEIVHNPLSFSFKDFIFNFTDLFKYDLKSIVFVLIAFYLITNITLTGFDLSNADLKSSAYAGLALLAVMAIVIMTFEIFGIANIITPFLYNFATWFLALSSLAIFNALVVNIISHLLHFYLS